MATGCSSKEFESKFDKEMYYDMEFEEFCSNFEFTNSDTCWICNGYYGPNFQEPLCHVCHAFVFPHLEEDVNNVVTKYSDDEDSGNDEPPENRTEKDQFDDDDEDFDLSGLIQRPEPPVPRSVEQYLELLAEEPEEVDGNARPYPNDICSLPVEVLLTIFTQLDDISLCSVSQTCKHWQKIIETHTPQQMWKRYTRERWPLFQQISTIPNWLHMYSALMNSCFCRACLIQMSLKTPLPQINNFRTSHLRRDMKTFHLDSGMEGISAIPLDQQLSHWQATILGPGGSPYEGGKFFLYIQIPASYPMTAPKVRFLTKIIHPNVSRHGDIGIDIINHNWLLSLGISKLLLSVQSLLTDPFTQVCMEPEIGRLYENERTKFEALARSWTWKYAMYEVLPPMDGFL